MGLKSFKGLIDAYDDGRTKLTSWRKQPTQTTAAGIWYDLSMSPGNPVPNYYAAAPGELKTLARSTDYGIDHGGPVAPLTKHLKQFMALTTTATAVPLPVILCDYLGYYPFLDMSVAGGEFQAVVNNAALTRSVTGKGVQIMAIEVASQIGGAQFYVTYTNQSGISGRVTATATCNTQWSNGTVITSAPNTAGSAGPFLSLQPGDTGVRSIEGVTFLGAGDVGLISLVLVKPLASHSILEITAPAERDYSTDSPCLPVIDDDAYLNLLCCPSGTLSGAPIHGLAEFVWG